MRRHSAGFGALAGIAALGLAQHAAADTYTIDSSHTQVMFAVNHLGFSTSHGGFVMTTGTVELDQKNPQNTTVDVTIEAKSLRTFQDKRDDHLRSDDFFAVQTYPAITFKSTKVERTGDKTAKLTGDLTLLGVTKPVTLNVVLNKIGPHPFRKEKTVAGFSATGSLKRSDFGMTYGVPNVGDEVRITIEAELSK